MSHTSHPYPSSALVLNRDEALDNLDGDQELYQLIIGTFLAEASSGLNALIQALHEGNQPRIAEEAHTMKGMAAAIGASRFGDYMNQLQNSARATASIDTTSWLQLLPAEFTALIKALDAL